MRSIFFEWQDFEQEIVETERINIPEAEFTTDLYTLEKSQGYYAISIFTDCTIPDSDLPKLYDSGTRKLALRTAGFNNVNVDLAKEIGFEVFRVARYSPESIAEFAFTLLLATVRKIPVEIKKHKNYENHRTKESMGTALHGRAIGIYGLGKIGQHFSEIAKGFGMYVIYFDPVVQFYDGIERVNSLEELFDRSQFVSIHAPLNEHTKHSVNYDLISKMRFKPNYLINTARGDILNSDDTIKALDEGILSGLGVDVWDSGDCDDMFDSRLLRDNVIQTKHIAFLTKESVETIVKDTRDNILGNPKDYNIL